MKDNKGEVKVEKQKLTGTGKLGKKEAFPPREIISRKSTVSISQYVSMYHQNPIPVPVHRHTQRRVTG